MQHVIVGGGPVAINAVEVIRSIDGGASRITLISDEPAHSRMALPYWLSGQIPREHTYTADQHYWRELGVEARIGERVVSIDSLGRIVQLSGGQRLAFDRLLIATGASPVGLRVSGGDLPGVQPLWTLAHTEVLLNRAASIKRPRVVLIGAGFIGLITLNAMFKRGWKLAVIEREPQLLPRMLSRSAAEMVQKWLTDRGVQVCLDRTVEQIEDAAGGAKRVMLAEGDALEADLVVVATGIRPNLDLIHGASIAIDQGILVDKRMQTSVQDIYAGGDVAQGPDLLGDRPVVHAIQPTAVDHGRVAGANMAGRETHYPGSLLMNILDVCGLQCASFGRWDDPSAEAMTIANPDRPILRQLLWQGDQVTGAIFLGPADDLGMLTDVGMVKGMIQTRTHFGQWKDYLAENPFDIRRAFVAGKVAERLAGTTLLGTASAARRYRYGNKPAVAEVGVSHKVFVEDAALD